LRRDPKSGTLGPLCLSSGVGHQKMSIRHDKRLVVLVGVMGLLLTLMVTLGRGSRSRDLKIAADLLELQRRWDTSDNVPSLFQSLTNLPFRQGAAGPEKAWVNHRYGLLGMHFDEYYFIQRPLPATDASDWTFYHAWYWVGHRELVMRKLLTTSGK
jgi:hypothetical protein